MFNLPNKFGIWYLVFGILLAFIFYLLSFTPVNAVCVPVDPTNKTCSAGLAACGNDTTCCTFPEECTQRKTCSSDAPHERIPSCDVCGGVLFCSGNNYRLCTTDSIFPEPQLGINRATYVANPPSSVAFNGVTYSVPSGGLYYCDSNLYGCGNSSCGGGSVGGQGESRIWFPHIRLIAALSTIAQSLFNPKPSTLARNTAPSNRTPGLENPTVVTTRIEEHQGALDGTTVVNESDNNSSLIVGREAPAPLYSFGNTSDDNPYNDSAQCRIDNTYTNPGDDLVGPKITGSLYYTQKYEYTAKSKPLGCIADGSPYPANRSRECCSGIYQSNLLCGKLEGVRIPTKGKIALFVKNPLIEYIYNSLVAGSDSLFKRFMPSEKTQKFEEIGTPVTFSASATSANHEGSLTDLAVGGDTSAEPTLYVPHLGSMKKYWLDDLQKALRPKTIGATTTSGGQCNYSGDAVDSAIQNASSKYKVPASLLHAIFEIEGADYLANPSGYACQENFAGAAGVMQITSETYNVVTCENERISNDVGLCTENTSKLSRCDVNDAFELGARTLLWKAGKWVYGPGNCQATGGISESNKIEIYNASCRYYGSFKPDNLTIAASRAIPASERRQDGDMNYCDLICYKMGLCPPYPAR